MAKDRVETTAAARLGLTLGCAADAPAASAAGHSAPPLSGVVTDRVESYCLRSPDARSRR